MSGLQAQLDVARGQLGYQERSGNRTVFGAWYGMDGNAWCDMFVSWCAAQAGNADVIGKFAYTPSHAAWFQARGQWGRAPRVGAIVFYIWPGMNRISHVGLVEAVRSDGSIVALEGNTNPGGASRTGGGVYRVVRRSNIAGYGYPAYRDAPAPPTVTLEFDMARLPELTRGATDATHVRILQGLLNAGHAVGLCRAVDIDGDFGPGTDAAVREYQRAMHLEVDGVVGAGTYGKLLAVA